VQLDTQQVVVSDVFEFERERRGVLLGFNLPHTIYRRGKTRIKNYELTKH
jgi:hypothetical protein